MVFFFPSPPRNDPGTMNENTEAPEGCGETDEGARRGAAMWPVEQKGKIIPEIGVEVN